MLGLWPWYPYDRQAYGLPKKPNFSREELLVDAIFTGAVMGIVGFSQAVGLESGLHGRRPTRAFAPFEDGIGLESGARPSPDSSGSPQQGDAMTFCTVI